MSIKSLFFTQKLTTFFGKPVATTVPVSATDLQRRYLPAVFGYISARVPVVADAEDVCAEVFAAAFANIRAVPLRPATPTDDPARAWLFGIARRKITDAYRKRSRRPESSLDAVPFPPRSNAPESSALADEAAHALRTILQTLSEPQREALLLKYVEELTLEEIGVVLQKSPNAVAQLLHRARQTVRERGAFYFTDTEEIAR